jgi:nucleoside-diphosphate-sugar epimerase
MDEMIEHFAHATGIKRRMVKLPPSVLGSITNLYAGTLAKRFPRIPQRLTPAAIRVLQLNRHANTQKAQKQLGFQPTAVRDAIGEAYEFYCREGMIRRPALTRTEAA